MCVRLIYWPTPGYKGTKLKELRWKSESDASEYVAIIACNQLKTKIRTYYSYIVIIKFSRRAFKLIGGNLKRCSYAPEAYALCSWNQSEVAHL